MIIGWYCWKGNVWERQQKDDTFQATVQQIADANGWRNRAVNITNGIHREVSSRLLKQRWDELDHLLPFQDGVFDLQTKTFRPHNKDDGLTWCLPRNYETCDRSFPKIDAWLTQVSNGSESTKHLLMCWLNAVLTGKHHIQKFLHLLGRGGSGKGTYQRLCMALIGQNNAHVSNLAVFNQNRFEPGNLLDKRLVIFADEDKYSGDLGVFKSATGGDLLRCEQKNKDAYPFMFKGLAMVNSNFPVFAGDKSSGLARRVIPIEFTLKVTESERKDLDKEFEPELPALTHYLLTLPDREVEQTLIQSSRNSAVEALSLKLRLRTDSLTAWINECVIRESGAESPIGNSKGSLFQLYGNYCRWCEDSGNFPVASKEFSPQLVELCRTILQWEEVEVVHRRDGNKLVGLRLRQPGRDDGLPCPIDAVIQDCEGSTGVGEGSVKGDVKGEILDTQGCEGCGGSTDIPHVEEINGVPNEVPSFDIEQDDVGIYPSHPSQLDRAGVPASTPSFTHPSPSFTKVMAGDLVRYVGNNPILVHHIGDQILPIHTIKQGMVNLIRPDGRYTTWIPIEDVMRLESISSLN